MQSTVFAAYIFSHPGIKPAEAAQDLDVSVRTIRTYVSQANAQMESFAHIDHERGSGYRIEITDHGAFDAWTHEATALRTGSVPQTPQERVTYLLNDLLMRNDWITLDDLANILYVSRGSISGDLKEVGRVLDRFGLTLERRSHYGIRITGPEIARRVCFANIVMSQYGRPSINRRFPEEDLLKDVAACVDEAVHGTDFQINSVAYQNLLVHIAVALMRMRENFNVPMEATQLAEIKQTREFPVALEIARLVSERFNVEVPEEEAAYIAIHLAGKQTLNIGDGDAAGLVISDEVWEQVSAMLECIYKVYRFDFRADLELRMNLARHIVPLAVRLQYNMDLKNPLLSDIKVRYPLAYAMAIDASTVLAERYGNTLSEDEVGYIALAFALALERQKTETPKKNILMVCASGAGSARLLEWRCQQEFGSYIGTISTCDVLDIDRVDFSTIDYVFTTVPINRQLPVPVREVKYFLDTTEVEEVKELLRGEEASEGSSILDYFDHRLFFPHLSFDSKIEALDYLLAKAAEVKEVAPNFSELVWKREGSVATTFGNNVAMPHPLESASKETFVVVGLLDNPVPWDDYGRTVQAVFLSSFGPSEGSELRGFYSTLADMLSSQRAITALVEDQTWETLSALLTTFSTDRATREAFDTP